MNYGVVYKFKPQHKINGTLFYCFEHFKFLRKYVDCKFYIIDITASDLVSVLTILKDKYNTDLDHIVPIKLIDVYGLKLDKTLVLDINTFSTCKEFLTNQIICCSNEEHEMFRYKNDRQVTYYGSYQWQPYDVFNILKLNFEIFAPLKEQGYGVFISSLDQKHLRLNINQYQREFNRPLIIKKNYTGIGNLFDLIDAVHYVHVRRDANNRIIPEAFFYKKTVTIEEAFPNLEIDSIQLRYNDIKQHGLKNYTLSEDDEMIKAMLS